MHVTILLILDVQMVELGFAALASLAQTWDSAEPDEDEDDGKALTNWKIGCATVANTLSQLLQRAWLPPPQVKKLYHFVHRQFCQDVISCFEVRLALSFLLLVDAVGFRVFYALQ